MRAVRVAVWIVMAALVGACRPSGGPAPEATSPVASTPAAGAIRLTGNLEAIRSRTVAVPRLAGTTSAMIITTLAKPGARVEAGDVLVEFDPQEQQRLASDRRAELIDLDSQIDRKRAEQAAAEAKERTGIVAAENDIARAKLAVSTNELVARVVAEKNTLTLQQHTARLEQLQTTFKLRREAAAADLRILEIRKERAERALRYAEENATRMRILAPFPGLVVVKTMWRPGREGAVEIMEGDEVRPGYPIIDVVDTSAMQVRARVNQADAGLVRGGQAATIRLDGFPELSFKGRVEQVTPLATTGMSQTVRTLVAIVSVEGTHAQLLPDLTASVEIMPAASPRPMASGRGSQ